MINFHVVPEQGEPFDIEATSRDVLMWERTTKGAKLANIENDLHLADMYKIAWFTAKRLGLFTGSQAEFEESHDLDFEKEEEPDPTQPGR